MTEGPLKPNRRVLPAGFVDAIGLDDEAFEFKPYVIKPKSDEAERTHVVQVRLKGGRTELLKRKLTVELKKTTSEKRRADKVYKLTATAKRTALSRSPSKRVTVMVPDANRAFAKED